MEQEKQELDMEKLRVFEEQARVVQAQLDAGREELE
jgi:hypothetical protein